MAVIYYTESTPVLAYSGNSANAAATATINGVAGRTAYLTGFTVTGSGATAASLVTVTVSNIVSSGGSSSFYLGVPAGTTSAITPLQVNFPMPIPATAVNTPIAVSAGAFGSGSTNATVVAYGYYK
jgi:hypothetical protein